jgi:hypothetical protein
MCHMSPIIDPILFSWPNIENVYCMKTCNGIVKRVADTPYAIGNGHRRVSSDVCIIRISYTAWDPWECGFTVSFPL